MVNINIDSPEVTHDEPMRAHVGTTIASGVRSSVASDVRTSVVSNELNNINTTTEKIGRSTFMNNPTVEIIVIILKLFRKTLVMHCHHRISIKAPYLG